MSDSNTSRYEDELCELRKAQNSSETQHHIDTKDILYITTKTKALVTTIACLAAVSVAVVIAAGCGVAKATEERPVSIKLGESNIRRVIERALWLDCNVGCRTAGGAKISEEIIREEAHRVYEHNQFRWDLPFKHPSYRGWKLEHLRERSRGVFADELKRIHIDNNI
jgi:hypothetical protein